MIGYKKALKYELSLKPPGSKEVAFFAENLSIMLRSGLTLTESLEVQAEQSGGKMRRIIRDIQNSVSSGNSFSDSLASFPKLFPLFFVSSARSGESSGNLHVNLADIAEQMKREEELSGKIRAAMAYPVIILFLSTVVGFGLVYFVLPRITPMFSSLGVELPLTTRILIRAGGIIRQDGRLILFAFLTVFAFSAWFFKRRFMIPFNHYLLLRMPVVGPISRNRNLAVFGRSLGTMIKSGLSFDESLAIAGSTLGNYHFRSSLARAGSKVATGAQLSESLEGSFFPPLAVSLVKVGERTGKLEEELFNIAGIYDKKVADSAKMLPVVLEPLLLIIIGLFVGLLAISIITPIYKITGGIY